MPIALAKGIAGGVPMGALITFGAASDLFAAGQHGTTFGGNPLATAAANAVLREIEASDLLGNATAAASSCARRSSGSARRW